MPEQERESRGEEQNQASAEQAQLEAICLQGINEGVGLLVKDHPYILKRVEDLNDYFDQGLLAEGIRKQVEYVRKRSGNWNPQYRTKKLQQKVASFVASGVPFNKEGKEVILRNTLRESGIRIEGKSILEGEADLNRTLDAFRKVYQIYRQGNLKDPELERAFQQVEAAGFASAADDVLYAYGLREKREYLDNKTKAQVQVKQGGRVVVSRIDQYLTPREQQQQESTAREKYSARPSEAHEEQEKNATRHGMAALVLGILGIGFLIGAGAKLTGNVIGESSFNSGIGLIVGILLIIGAFLFARKGRRK